MVNSYKDVNVYIFFQLIEHLFKNSEFRMQECRNAGIIAYCLLPIA